MAGIIRPVRSSITRSTRVVDHTLEAVISVDQSTRFTLRQEPTPYWAASRVKGGPTCDCHPVPIFSDRSGLRRGTAETDTKDSSSTTEFRPICTSEGEPTF